MITIFSANGYEVTIEVRSRSGKQSWQADCRFDPQTGGATYYFVAYPQSTELRRFIEEVGWRNSNRA
jgi:hypothetical protein